ncbi:hypothetical protein [Variovorax sp. PAMC26660]|uniref:hypothetical protein n=1 Tax=Variovorax sp. PAMC26660 TaxID=2762322 RepID=UPI00164D89A1|nr:hypothetical protein [Variovorax sp. PAMC26660]QNK67158.1 hypothetical protein H7F35_29035 [Variovorax sp. PAMC26660]
MTIVTGCFHVVDANGNESTVTEYMTYLVRVSTTKSYSPMLGGIMYYLSDGTGVRRTCANYFASENGAKRFFVTGKRQQQAATTLANMQSTAPAGAQLQ